MLILFFMLCLLIECKKHLINTVDKEGYVVETNHKGNINNHKETKFPVKTVNDVMESGENMQKSKMNNLIETVNKEGYAVETYTKKNMNTV